MHAPYDPPPFAAACPHCGEPVGLVVDSPALDWATVTLRCPACRGDWREIRDADGTTLRYWEPRAAEQPA